MSYDYSNFDAYAKHLEQLQNSGFQVDNTSQQNVNNDESIFTMANGGVDYSKAYDNLIDEYFTNIAKIEKEEAEREAQLEAEKAKKAQESTKTDSTDNTSDDTKTTSDDNDKVEESTDDASADESNNTVSEDDSDQYREDFDPMAIASSINDATQNYGIFGWGTNEEVIEKYFKNDTKLNDAEIRAVNDAYKEKYGVDLIEVMKGDFSGVDENKYVATIQSALNGNDKGKDLKDDDRKEYIKGLAQEFHDATVAQCGTDEAKVWEIMQLDKATLKEVIDYYNKSPFADKKDFRTAIEDEFSWVSGQGDLIKLYEKAEQS